MHKSRILQDVETWAQAVVPGNYEKRYQMTCRFKLIGLLFGVEDAISRALDRTLDAGIGFSDDNLMSSGFRVVIELKNLGLVEPVETQQVLQRITDERLSPQ